MAVHAGALAVPLGCGMVYRHFRLCSADRPAHHQNCRSIRRTDTMTTLITTAVTVDRTTTSHPPIRPSTIKFTSDYLVPVDRTAIKIVDPYGVRRTGTRSTYISTSVVTAPLPSTSTGGHGRRLFSIGHRFSRTTRLATRVLRLSACSCQEYFLEEANRRPHNVRPLTSPSSALLHRVATLEQNGSPHHPGHGILRFTCSGRC